MERKLELPPGSLEGSKKHVKETIGYVMSELNQTEDGNDASSEAKPDILSSPAEKLKRRRAVDNEGERAVKPKKRKSNDAEKPSRDSSRKPPTKKFKSSVRLPMNYLNFDVDVWGDKEMIPTSDAEPDEPAEIGTIEVALSNGKPKAVEVRVIANFRPRPHNHCRMKRSQ